MSLVIVILVLLLTLAFFYLKCSMMQSLMTLWSAVLTTIVAFSYYEWVANLFISRGYAPNFALCGSFTLLFVVIFASLRSLSELLITTPVDLGNVVKLPVALVCGLLAGIIFSGNLLVALGLLPLHGKIFYRGIQPGESMFPRDYFFQNIPNLFVWYTSSDKLSDVVLTRGIQTRLDSPIARQTKSVARPTKYGTPTGDETYRSV